MQSAGTTSKTVKDEEDDYRDNIPENMQSSDRYYQSEEASENLEAAFDTVEEIYDKLDEIFGYLEEAMQ